MVGRLSKCAESCAAEIVFSGRHDAEALPFFNYIFASWAMVGWHVTTSGRQCLDVSCFCFNSSGRGILVTLFHCYVICSMA